MSAPTIPRLEASFLLSLDHHLHSPYSSTLSLHGGELLLCPPQTLPLVQELAGSLSLAPPSTLDKNNVKVSGADLRLPDMVDYCAKVACPKMKEADVCICHGWLKHAHASPVATGMMALGMLIHAASLLAA